MNKRYLELDSLRGLAAIAVLFYHCLRIFPSFDISDPNFVKDGDSWLINTLLNTPLQIIWSGHESVILFFVLSGFVLSIPYYAGKEIEYKTYILKRTVRIYIPFFVATTIAVIANLTLSKNGISMYSTWFNKIWTSETTFLDILNQILFLGYYNADQYNTVVWSLAHEMRISIIFPLLMLAILRFNWKTNIGIGLTFSLVAFILLVKINPTFNTNIILTLHYTSMFMIGSLLAKHIESIVDFYKKLPNFIKMLSFVFAIVSYTYSGLFTNIGLIHNFLIDEYAVVVGSSLFIIIALSSGMVSRLLNLKPMLFLGKISYSLYLYHTIILFSLIYAFSDIIPIYIILLSTIVISVIVASIAYYLVEKPSMKLGRKLTDKQEIQKKIA
ncbi:acyltransferase family protein [Bacillus albus]|uniref:acyltransferase family protein n=1 Tax=Bacillus albus TaxID=2026189 RepID=UPI0018A171D8|nr:acyltransferase [Bacillus albus]MBF7155707.1 acyltransferase [Bacillus albus]